MTNFLHSSRSSSSRRRGSRSRKPSLFSTTTRPLPPANRNLPHPSFPNTLLRLTSPHDQPHYFISPAANLMTSKQVTSPPGHIPSWNGWTFVHTRKAVLAPHWSDALYTSSRHAFGTALVRRLVHVVCASFYFGTSHVLLGKTVAMGGCNLKMKKSWRGVGGEGAAPPPPITRSIHTDVAAWVCLIYRLRSWNQPNCACMRRCPDASPQNQPHYFSLWYQSCPSWQDCGHGRRQPKNKKRWRGVGGRAQRLPPRCRATRSIHTDVAAWVCLIYRLRSWNQPNCAYMRRCPDTSPQNQPHLRSSHAPTPPPQKKKGLGCGHIYV